MSDSYSDIPSEGEWEDGGEGDLAWNEFDWEVYLREQDALVDKYLALHDGLLEADNRIDAAAEGMGWQVGAAEGLEGADADGADEGDDFDGDDDVYTLCRNPVFIATRALFLGLRRTWVLAAADAKRVPPSLSLAYLDSLHGGESLACMAVHALEFGDYAMAIAFFKRALASLNASLGILSGIGDDRYPTVLAYRDGARRRIFDLREIWLRVMEECRSEISRPIDDEG